MCNKKLLVDIYDVNYYYHLHYFIGCLPKKHIHIHNTRTTSRNFTIFRGFVPLGNAALKLYKLLHQLKACQTLGDAKKRHRAFLPIESAKPSLQPLNKT